MKIRKEIRANKKKEDKNNWKKIGVKNKQRKSGKQIQEKNENQEENQIHEK